MQLNLAGQRAVIAGASRGIGHAIAQGFAAEGTNVDLAARDKEVLVATAEQLSSTHGITVRQGAYDLSLPEQQGAMAEEFSGADILVNVAGAIPSGEIDVLSDEDWRRGWELKVFGFINLARLFYKQMKSRGSGVIINIIGMAGIRLDALNIAGSTGNAALMAFSRCLGARSVDFGVRVIGVNPSLTDTDRAASILRHRAQEELGDADRWQEFVTRLPMGRLGRPEEIADMVVFLASDRASYVSGSIVNVDGGLGGRP